MERIQIIKDLAQYCHPSWYHQVLNWKTESLKLLLDYYKNCKEVMIVGVDIAIEDEVEITLKFN